MTCTFRLSSDDLAIRADGTVDGLPLHLDLAVSRFLEIRRTNRPHPHRGRLRLHLPRPPARTLSDLTPEEHHLLHSVSLLDVFDPDLATRTAGLAQARQKRLPPRKLTPTRSDQRCLVGAAVVYRPGTGPGGISRRRDAAPRAG